jgi:hypothetical protein
MFKAGKHGREKLFEQAMLARKERPTRRRTVPGETESLPWVSVSLWTAFALVGGYILLFSPALMIQRVTVEGESVVPLGEYEDFAETSLAGAYFGILKKRNYFLAPTGEIAGRMLERYPLLSDATVERHFPDTLSFSLHEAPAILHWCSGGPCYGVREGRAVAFPYAEDDRYASSRLSVIDESALPVQIGALLPVEPYLETFRTARDSLARLTESEVLPIATTPSRHSNELALSTEEGWRLFIAVDRPTEESLGTLSVFLAEYGREHPDRSKLDTVDLRVEGKVFYAESGQPAEEAETSEGDPAASLDKENAKKKKKSD